jgi:succinate-acetate transporter protein
MSLDPQTTLADNHDHHGVLNEKRPLVSETGVRTPYLYHSTRQPFLPHYHSSRIANPSPLAFMALAVGLYIISMVALGAEGLSTLNIVTTVGLGFSGVALLVAVRPLLLPVLLLFSSHRALLAAVALAGPLSVPQLEPVRRCPLLHSLRLFYLPVHPPLALVRRLEVRPLSSSSPILVTDRSLGQNSSYTDTSEFQAAVAQFMYAFFIAVFLFLVAAHRSSGGLLLALCLIDFALLFIGLCECFPLPPLLLLRLTCAS